MAFWSWYWRVVLVLAILFVLAFAAFIWPTPWRYEHVYALNHGRAYCINRFTGSVYQYGANGWEPVREDGRTSLETGRTGHAR
jgi:hypothetical protein